jgi:hypothetical protein
MHAEQLRAKTNFREVLDVDRLEAANNAPSVREVPRMLKWREVLDSVEAPRAGHCTAEEVFEYFRATKLSSIMLTPDKVELIDLDEVRSPSM